MEERNSDVVVKVWEINKERLACMQQKIWEEPRLMSKTAGRSSCCIFRVPRRLVEINVHSYQPHIISIGPYHRGEPHLRMIEEHKWRYLGSLIARTEAHGLGLEDYLKALHPLETKARECYSEIIQLDTHDFLEMMVLDGCFIVDFFRKIGNIHPFEPDDPLVSMSWVFSFFLRDLLLLENQLPFFVLERLFDITKMPGEESGPSLASLALGFFNNTLLRPEVILQKHSDLKGKHLLDLLRLSFIPEEHEVGIHDHPPTHLIQCVSKLRKAGIKLMPGNSDSFLTVKFRNGVIEMPPVTIDDFLTCFFQNCVAFELCHKDCTKHITTYATLLDCLINTAKDVEYLCDRNIFENYFGTDSEVARFINNLGKDVTFDADNCYLSKLFNDVNEYYRNGWHVQLAGMKYTYFDTPWSFISAFAAFLLLLLTIAQTFYTVYPYFRPP